MTDSTTVDPYGVATTSKLDAHPVGGLATLFFTEMWERFSYYGMRAMLVLFMTASITEGNGMGMDDMTATAIYGLYTAAVYVSSLPGGWIADRLLGAQKSVWYGGIIIMIGHFTLAIPAVPTFYLGLVFVVLGTGLLKPNISSIVGELYPEGGSRRDAGYTIYYMGVNLGAMLGPLVCSTLGESDTFGWHYGFAAAGVGMLLGLVQYRLMSHHLGDAGMYPDHLNPQGRTKSPPRYGWLMVGIGTGVVAFVTILALVGAVTIEPIGMARVSTVAIGLMAALYFVYVFMFGNLDGKETRCVAVIVVLVLAEAIFWSGFEQTGSSLNLFAERYTDRMIGGFEVPTGWYQSLNPLFILIFAPMFAAMWVNLAKRNLNPSIPVKFALGLIQLGLGFLVMYGASLFVINGESVMPTWLFFTYLLHTTGELCLSPVGLSAVSKLSPKRFVSQMMGIWFLGSAWGNILAGLLAGHFNPDRLEDMPGLYIQVILIAVGSGIILLLFTKPIKRWIGDIE